VYLILSVFAPAWRSSRGEAAQGDVCCGKMRFAHFSTTHISASVADASTHSCGESDNL